MERLLKLPYADENAFEEVEEIFRKVEGRSRKSPPDH
jgi:hypothetical protein